MRPFGGTSAATKRSRHSLHYLKINPLCDGSAFVFILFTDESVRHDYLDHVIADGHISGKLHSPSSNQSLRIRLVRQIKRHHTPSEYRLLVLEDPHLSSYLRLLCGFIKGKV